MKMSVPSFNEILEKNQLIHGRLNVKPADLEKLYQTLKKDNDRLNKKKAHYEEVIKLNITKRNEIKSQVKRNYESVQKSFYPSPNKISLLYKKQSKIYYIKARFYWEGKQREVQVGSIPHVIEIINSMIANKLFPNIKKIKTKKLTWEQIIKIPNLIVAIKEIASLKSQEYILRRLIQDKLMVMDMIDDSIGKEINITDIDEEFHRVPANNKSDNMGINESEEGVEWYNKWRRDNL